MIMLKNLFLKTRKTSALSINFNEYLKGKKLILFLDFDGTLASIADTPDEAAMTSDMKNVLVQLLNCPECHLTIISGRKLSDIKSKAAIPEVNYVGSHGFEIEGPAQFQFEGLISPQYHQDLRQIKNALITKMLSFRGVWIEDKGIILTIHYRLSDKTAETAIKKTFLQYCRPYIGEKKIKITEGKKVLEIRPPIKWDKGEAALWLLAKWQKQYGKDQIAVMYIGDDYTDEDAFRMLDGIALTVKVGHPKRSSADYFLNYQEEVIVLLNKIREVLIK